MRSLVEVLGGCAQHSVSMTNRIFLNSGSLHFHGALFFDWQLSNSLCTMGGVDPSPHFSICPPPLCVRSRACNGTAAEARARKKTDTSGSSGAICSMCTLSRGWRVREIKLRIRCSVFCLKSAPWSTDVVNGRDWHGHGDFQLLCGGKFFPSEIRDRRWLEVTSACSQTRCVWACC